MQWFFIALTAQFLWSLTNISDQYLVAKYATGERSSGGLVLFSSLIGVFVTLIIGVFSVGIFQIPVLDKLLLVLSGAISIVWIILYLYALEVEDVSAIVPWFLTVPIFGYVLGYIFLGENLSYQQLLGAVIVLLGVFLLSIDFSKNKNFFKSKSIFFMLPACLLIATTGVIFKYVTVGNSFWISSFWQYAGLGIFGIMILLFVPKYRNEFMSMNKSGGVKIFMLNTASEIFTIIGNLLTNYAMLLAPISLVFMVGSFQPVIVLFMALFATKFFPNIVKENLAQHIVLPKVIAIGIMIFGSIILFI